MGNKKPFGAEVDLESSIKTFVKELQKTLNDNFIAVEPYPEVSAKNRLYRTEDGIDADDLDQKAPIIPQLKAFADEHGIELDEGWKVQLSKRIKQKFKGEVSDELEAGWAELFKNIQDTAKKKNQ